MSADAPRRWRWRWWHWCCALTAAAALAPLAVIAAIRHAGHRRFDRVIADLRARDEPVDIDGFPVLAPPVDDTAEEAWSTWQASTPSNPYDFVEVEADALDAWQRDGTPLPATVLSRLEAMRPTIEPARALLRSGRLSLSSAAWFAKDFPPGARTAPQIFRMRTPSLLAVRMLASWLQREAFRTDDPGPPLQELDALRCALARPATLIDAMVLVAFETFRDEAYLRLALRGALAPAVVDQWSSEPPADLAAVGAAFVGERLAFAIPSGAWDRAHPIDAMMETMIWSPTPRPWWHPVVVIAFAPADLSRLVEGEALISSRLRGGAAAWSEVERIRREVRSQPETLANLVESARTALERETMHRVMRIAARLARLPEAPIDMAAAVDLLGRGPFIAQGDRLALAFERLSRTRCRVTVDPHTPVPDFYDAARIGGLSELGKPATSTRGSRLRPLVIRRATVEMELPLPSRPDAFNRGN